VRNPPTRTTTRLVGIAVAIVTAAWAVALVAMAVWLVSLVL
jgi:hypothetical protein